MTERGTVINIDNNIATVRIGRSSACGNCNMCGMSEEKKHVDLYVDNTLNAQAGDIVQLDIVGSSATRTSIIAYLVPLVIALAGMFIALLCHAKDWVMAIVFIVGLALGYFVIWLLEKKFGKKLGVQATMIEIIAPIIDINQQTTQQTNTNNYNQETNQSNTNNNNDKENNNE